MLHVHIVDIQRTGADKILGLGGCHGDVLKIGDECHGHVLNMGLFFLLLKDPDTQMTCNTPKIWPHFGCNKHIFRLFSSLLFSSVLKEIVVRRA